MFKAHSYKPSLLSIFGSHLFSDPLVTPIEYPHPRPVPSTLPYTTLHQATNEHSLWLSRMEKYYVYLAERIQ